ncbi:MULTISPECIES: hypothetical protein [unclassified Streptomyces]|uniref:hypothetical protein n=1 Tax=unclassified Streptomyces TaxID=2593676 RepID=UPI00352EE121|nr:hypothetical protein OG306_15395 [Streptomyces sp. NBC_01241]
MTRLRLSLCVGGLLLVLVAGGLAWSAWSKGGDGEDLADRCQGSLAVEEARQFFDGARLKARGHTADWGGHDAQWCSVWAQGDDSGPVLKLRVWPRASYRSSGTAADASATPIGHGWTGSFVSGYSPGAAVLVDCKAMAGAGLLVTAETSRKTEDLSARQLLQVARVATETARRAAGRAECEGVLGERPGTVDRAEWTTRPVGRATGTCGGVVTGREAARLRVTDVTEKPAGRALTEQCAMGRGKSGLFSMTGYYGPSAQEEMYLDNKYPGTVKGAYTRTVECGGAIGTAYFKLERAKGKAADGAVGTDGASDPAALKRILESYATASGERHGCPAP